MTPCPERGSNFPVVTSFFGCDAVVLGYGAGWVQRHIDRILVAFLATLELLRSRPAAVAALQHFLSPSRARQRSPTSWTGPEVLDSAAGAISTKPSARRVRRRPVRLRGPRCCTASTSTFRGTTVALVGHTGQASRHPSSSRASRRRGGIRSTTSTADVAQSSWPPLGIRPQEGFLFAARAENIPSPAPPSGGGSDRRGPRRRGRRVIERLEDGYETQLGERARASHSATQLSPSGALLAIRHPDPRRATSSVDSGTDGRSSAPAELLHGDSVHHRAPPSHPRAD